MDGQSVQSHINTMTKIFDKLAIIGDPLNKRNQVVRLLASLPESYDILATVLESNPGLPKLEVVTEGLLHEETKRKDKETNHSDVKAMTSKHRSSKRGLRCYYCGKYGHIKQECLELSKHSGKVDASKFKKKPWLKQRAYAAEKDSEDEDVLGLVVEHALIMSSAVSDWIIDSGSNCHMCNNEDLFVSISKLEKPQEITLGDGYSVEATGKGTVQLNLKFQMTKLNAVNYITVKLLYIG